MNDASVNHILGISGGKDSAALAIYLKDNYPSLRVKYYFCDTDKELKETYDYIRKIEDYLGAPIELLKAAPESSVDQFDHFLKLYGNFLPSPTQRWCTKRMKLDPFERYVGDTPTISYVAIRGDEDREGYVSKKRNIQTVFPFRQNIWSAEIVNLVLMNKNISVLMDIASDVVPSSRLNNIHNYLQKDLTREYTIHSKLNDLLNYNVIDFNKLVFDFLLKHEYPVSMLSDYPLLEDTRIVDKAEVFRILESSGVGLPGYYDKLEFEVEGEKGVYFRSRSGCFFCFYQQKIEWIWLFENHPELFAKAIEYEKEGYTWMQDEKLEDLVKADRMADIKRAHIFKQKNTKSSGNKLFEVVTSEDEDEGCLSCFL